MSESYPPMTALFDFQRVAIGVGVAAVTSGIEFQRRLARATVRGLDSNERLQRQSLEMGRELTHTTVGLMEELPGGFGLQVRRSELRSDVDEGFDRALLAHESLFDGVEAMVEDGLDGYVSVSESYLELVAERREATERRLPATGRSRETEIVVE